MDVSYVDILTEYEFILWRACRIGVNCGYCYPRDVRGNICITIGLNTFFMLPFFLVAGRNL